ncbi:MAG: hypothetical protein A2Z31_08340 [candidate division NC10 bacterium RBG_16_65_8]|nr:MAG: hypothetical protein A2Z31_08340 [candidate division NC10 bacterium RBG_16_65_8]
MATREELEEEDRRVRQLRTVVHLAFSAIAQTDIGLTEAEKLVSAVRGAALRLFPGKELTFDLIYLPRFRRLLAERYGPVSLSGWSAN